MTGKVKKLQREFGVIGSFHAGKDHDHDCLTCSIGIRLGEGAVCEHQAFGGVLLSDEYLDDFTKSLFKVFDVQSQRDLVGQECFALRCWGFHNDLIEGIESKKTGKRFTLTGWRRKTDQITCSPIDGRRNRILRDIASKERRVSELQGDLIKLHEGYIDWETYDGKC